MDDDINTVIKLIMRQKGRTEMDQVYYGYTTWQMEVGRNYTGGTGCPETMVTGMRCISGLIP